MTGAEPDAVPVDAVAAAAFDRCIADGRLAIFPADTVYGIAADPESECAVARLNALKRRDPSQPSGVMFFSFESMLTELDGLGPATTAATERLLPGPLTLVLPNPRRRFPLACGEWPDRLGVRVPALAGPLAPLATVGRPVLQSSANLHGGPDPRRIVEVPAELCAAADLILDGGELPGVASTVVDLSDYERSGAFTVLREGAVPADELASRLPATR